MPTSAAKHFRPLRVAALPFALPPGGIADRLRQAAGEGVNFAVFPELSLAGGVRLDRLRRAELETLAEPLFGPSIDAVAQAVEATNVAAGVGWLERGDDGALYNSYVVCIPGGARHRHRKVYALESPHLHAGECFDVFDTPWGVATSILIGADNYLPENARLAALKGATLLVAPHRSDLAAARARSPQREWYLRALPVRAGDNGMFAVLSDAPAGSQRASEPGAALIADPSGAVLAAGEASQSTIAAADVDPRCALGSLARRWLNARRPELYGAFNGSETQPRNDERATDGAIAARKTPARGSIAVSFAVVGRKRSTP